MSICIKIFSPFFDDRKLGATQISLNSITRKKVLFLWNIRISETEIRVRFFPWTGCGKPHVVFFIIFLFRRKREDLHLDIQTTISRTFWACTHNRDSNSNSIQRGDEVFTRRFDEPNKHIRFTQIRIPLSPLHSGHHSKLPSHGLRAGFLYSSRVCYYFLGKLTICQIGNF